ncbi:MAG: GumC family protein [bacterium]
MADNMRDEKKFSIIDYFRVLWGKKYYILFIAFVVTFGAGVATLLMTPKYQASTAIVIPQTTTFPTGLLPTGVGTLMSMIGFGQMGTLETETYILTGLNNLKNVADELNLYVDRRKIPKDELGESVIGPISINDTASSGKYEIRFIDNSGNYVVYLNKRFYLGSGRLGDTFSGGGLKFVITNDNFEKGDRIEFKIWDRVDLIKYLGNVAVYTKNPAAGILEIYTEWYDKVLSEKILISLLDQYFKSSLEYKYSALEESLAIIGEELETVNREMEDVQKQLVEYQKEHKTLYYGDSISEIVSALSDLMSQRVAIEIQRDLANKYFTLLAEDKIDVNDIPFGVSIPVVSDDPALLGLKSQVVTLDIEVQRMRAVFTEKHPSLIQTEREFNNLKEEFHERVLNSIKNRLEAINSQISTFERTFQDVSSKMPKEQMEMALMVKRLKELEAIYMVLSNEYERQKIEEIQQRPAERQLRFLHKPYAEDKPISPNKKFNLLVGFLSGIFLGSIIIFITLFMDVGEFERKHVVLIRLITIPDKIGKFFERLVFRRK